MQQPAPGNTPKNLNQQQRHCPGHMTSDSHMGTTKRHLPRINQPHHLIHPDQRTKAQTANVHPFRSSQLTSTLHPSSGVQIRPPTPAQQAPEDVHVAGRRRTIHSLVNDMHSSICMCSSNGLGIHPMRQIDIPACDSLGQDTHTEWERKGKEEGRQALTRSNRRGRCELQTGRQSLHLVRLSLCKLALYL